jgi:sec-independent protein translocase protein TatC
MVDKNKLNSLRPLIIVGILIVSAFITPPDIISQAIMFIPVYLSYETGMLLSKNKKEVKR